MVDTNKNTNITVQLQFEKYFTGLKNRKRDPIKPATLSAYASYWRSWVGPILGHLNLSQVDNGALKTLVDKASEAGLSAASIGGIMQLAKGIVGSCVDDNGTQLYPRKWNLDFIDAPRIESRLQHAPILAPLEVSDAIRRATKGYQALFVLLAATGVRIAEALAIRKGPNAVSSYWDPIRSIVSIKTQFRSNTEQSPKTASGVREIDLASDANTYLCSVFANLESGERLFQSSTGGPMRIMTAHKRMTDAGIPGFHSLRRFRITHLENQGVPAGFIRFWAGHSAQTTTERYVKLSQEMESRRIWAEKAGIGFELPEEKNDKN